MKKMLFILLCAILTLGVSGCNENPDPREREIIVLLNEGKFDDATSKAKELYKDEDKKLEEVLGYIEKSKDNSKKDKQMIQDAYPHHKLEIQSESTHRVSNGYAYINGKVKNVSNNKISYFEVVVDLLDDQGNIIHSEYANDGLELKPDAIREFEIMFKHSKDYKNYNLSIGKVK